MAVAVKLLVASFFATVFAASFAWSADSGPRLDLRLTASDLVDETVASWLRSAPFAEKTNLIVADIDAPIGLDTRFAEDMENHLFEVLRANPKLPLQLVHCSLCRQWVVESRPQKTVLGSALDQPSGREALAQYPHLHALSLHFEVVGRNLTLWAEIYEVAPPERVVWTQRFSQATSARAVLQAPDRIIGVNEARHEQEQSLRERESFQTVTRFPVRTFSNKSGSGQSVAGVPPLIFIEQAVEAAVSPRQNRRLGLSIGLTSLKDSLQGWSFGAEYKQLLGRSEPSLNDPDLYFLVGFNYLRLSGPGAAVFGQTQIDVSKLLNASEDPKASLTTYKIGLEARVKYKFGLSAFIEYIPALDESEIIQTHHLLIPFQSIGVSGLFLW